MITQHETHTVREVRVTVVDKDREDTWVLPLPVFFKLAVEPPQTNEGLVLHFITQGSVAGIQHEAVIHE